MEGHRALVLILEFVTRHGTGIGGYEGCERR